jgi:hypothetical protein
MHLVKKWSPVLGLLIFNILLSRCSRSNPEALFILVVLSFVALVVFFKQRRDKNIMILTFCLIRIPFLIVEPMLSDDFHRFHWDALVVWNGMSPYSILPSEVTGFLDSLFQKLNSPDYYSVYPPTMQLFFFTALLFPALKFVFALKLLYFIAEVILFIYIMKRCHEIGVDKIKFGFVSMLPLVVVEGLGNLHFEVIMVYLFFLALIVGKSSGKKAFASGLTLALSVLTKLTVAPVMVLFVSRSRTLFAVFLGFLVAFFALFFPFVDSSSVNAVESLGLYFGAFEFNASLYYLVRYLGYSAVNYNIIESYGLWFKALLLLFGLLIFIFSVLYNGKRRRLLIRWLNAFYIFYCLANPTLHPWYLLVPLFLSAFTHSWFWIMWSVLIYLSYFFYIDYQQVNWWLYTEYFGLMLVSGLCLWFGEKRLHYALFDQG